MLHIITPVIPGVHLKDCILFAFLSFVFIESQISCLFCLLSSFFVFWYFAVEKSDFHMIVININKYM